MNLVVPAAAWLPLAEAHAARADALTAAHRARQAARERHPIDDFLYDYYGTKPSLLRRWHPGAGAALGRTPDGPAEHAAWRWYATDDNGTVGLDVQALGADRGDTVRYVRMLLTATADRPARTGCLGLHEWAMVYRQDDARRRHTLPLRLGRDGTDAVVEAHPLRCSHFDAFRFFTPDAVPRNRVQLTRADQVGSEQPGCLHANMDLLCRQTDSPDQVSEPEPLTRQTQVLYEQPGCLHANMDLTKWSMKLGPAVPGNLLLDCFELAGEIRLLDMQASPYDLSSLGERAVAIETREGKAEYVARQREFAERAAALRQRIVEVCDDVLRPGELR
ncbi:MAG: 3-methyladenine DNA glycosylase [Cellulomonas sp.]|uniref:3-methyladenine DNA glycosylase n=1 Tax=Cellulomonas sp. TaxID=40001 RepID=UPI00182757FE|nr:3-methyladenine DNA glycosylase [Cellulomonas sp.]NMM29678.1 3-methyladenine DNA glycosylase [Cellulomonas sp.]